MLQAFHVRASIFGNRVNRVTYLVGCIVIGHSHDVDCDEARGTGHTGLK